MKRGEVILKRIIEIYKNSIHIHIENPLRTWWKARKYFRLPLIRIHFFSNIFINCPFINVRNVAKLLCISCSDVSYKWKYDDICFERNPYIWVCFFRTFGFSVNFNIKYKDEFGDLNDGSMYYWEYLLEYLYRFRTLKLNSWWERDSNIFTTTKYGKKSSEDIKVPMKWVIPVHLFSLNNKGLIKFKELYGKHM